MEEDNAPALSGNAHVIGLKSWLAYAGVVVQAVLALGVSLVIATNWPLVSGVVLAVATLVLGYRILLLRSVRLYYDDVGVWVYSGVLPWKKGVSGVKWRDMDEATFINGFWSWAARSYTVRISHRFTKESEIVVSHIADGKDVVGTLNARLQDMIRTSAVR